MRHPPKGQRLTRFTTGAFTLMELLAVIAIIGIATALLLPALSKARSRAQSMTCMNNLKELQVCVHLYVADFNDYFVPNNSIYVFYTNKVSANNPNLSITGVSWLPDLDAATEMNPSNIINGLLYQYNHALPIYHCPADLARLETSDGRPLTRQMPNQPMAMTASILNGPQLSSLRWRSYNMSQSVNGYPQGSAAYLNVIPTWSKYTDVRRPRPSELFVFIDENPDTMTDSEFGCPPLGSPNFWPNEWWDMPSDRHNRGANLSFVDGHVEHWKWVYPKVAYEQGQSVMSKEMPDYMRIQSGMKQLSDN